MKFFRYQYSGSLGEVWGLFAGLSSLSKEWGTNKDRKWDYSHTVEIVNSAMNGNLYSSQGDFDLRAYEIACSKTDEIELNNRRQKYLTIVDTVNGNDESTTGYGEISSNDKRLRVIEDAFELLDSNDEFEKCLSELYNIRKTYIVEKGIDPVEMLANSLKGIPEAINVIHDLVIEDTFLGELVQSLCENGRDSLQIRLEGAV